MSELELEPTEDAPERPAGQPWLRHAEVRDVSFPGRTIELVVMPYETPAMVAYDGRMVQEVIDRAAFAGIERRANRVRVNREHEVLHTVGRAVASRVHRRAIPYQFYLGDDPNWINACALPGVTS